MTNFLSAVAALALVGACLSQGEYDICLLSPSRGLCRAYMRMFYFDVHTGRCEEFIYGGCGGNANRFNTNYNCRETCQHLIPEYLDADIEMEPTESCPDEMF